MCQEGIRIGRRTDTNAAVQVNANAGPYAMLKRNPNRIAVTLVMTGYSPAGVVNVASLTTTIAGVSYPIGAVSPGAPAWKATVEELGQLVTGDLGLSVSDNGQTVTVTEVFLDTDLSEAARK